MSCKAFPKTSRDTFEELANTVLAVGSVGMVPISSSFASLFAEAGIAEIHPDRSFGIRRENYYKADDRTLRWKINWYMLSL